MKNNFDLRKFLTENKNIIKEENINELTGDQQEAIIELQGILDEAAQLGEQAKEIFREHFPSLVSKGEAYGAFDLGSSANSYDTTLESLIEETSLLDDEEEYDEEDLDEEVVNESLTLFGAIKFMLVALGGLATLSGVTEYIINAKEGKHGEKAQKGAEKLYKIMDYIGGGKKK